MKTQIKDSEIIVNIDFASILEDESIVKELTKYHAYTKTVLNCLAQIATTGQVDWDDDDEMPWRSYWTGPGETFEKLRLTIASIAEPTAQKLIDDLKTERDKQDKQITQLRAELFETQRQLRQKEKELA